ncbi:MAG TPA: VRR-NUC domain-containing protein [Aquella sp.]|nr:VRR-NUC domain-containing protein [Aquella sp.]
MKKIVPLESSEAKTFWAWSQYHPIARDHLLHITNEQKTSWATGKKLKAEGRRKGVSDYFLAYPYRGKGGIWIELKRQDKRVSRLTEEQASWLAQCIRVGYEAKVAYGADEAIKAVEDYLK